MAVSVAAAVERRIRPVLEVLAVLAAAAAVDKQPGKLALVAMAVVVVADQMIKRAAPQSLFSFTNSRRNV
jgi:hypothetical protein